MRKRSQFHVLAATLVGFALIRCVPSSGAIADSPQLKIHLAHEVITPGTQQAVTVITAPGLPVNFFVNFPNASELFYDGAADASGRITWHYRQAANKITPYRKIATVFVRTGGGSQASGSKEYVIRFAPLDVDIEPLSPEQGESIRVFVHCRVRTTVEVSLHFADGSSQRLTGRTGRDGWAAMSTIVPVTTQPGPVRVTAHAQPGKRRLSTSTTFRLQEKFVPTISIYNLRMLHRNGGDWTPATHAHLGEEVRFAADYEATERAGVWFPPAPSGILRILKDGKLLYGAPMQYAPPGPNSNPYIYADTRFTDPADVGQLDAEMTVRYGEAQDTATLHFTLPDSAGSSYP